jgi:hypothetical protein
MMFLSLMLAFSAASHEIRAKETSTIAAVLHASGNQPLTTETVLLDVDASFVLPVLRFTFGFATDEEYAPGQLADSFSVTLQDASLARTLIFLTADASGVVWGPPSPGTVPVDPESLSRTVMPFPGLIEPALGLQLAFTVQAPLSSEFAGQRLSLHFDLFDNLNGVPSLGWFGDVAVVPEPRLLAYSGMVLLFYLVSRKR